MGRKARSNRMRIRDKTHKETQKNIENYCKQTKTSDNNKVRVEYFHLNLSF